MGIVTGVVLFIRAVDANRCTDWHRLAANAMWSLKSPVPAFGNVARYTDMLGHRPPRRFSGNPGPICYRHLGLTS